MEEDSKTSISCISIFRDKKKAPDDQHGVPLLKRRKRSAAMRLFKVALCMLRMKSGKSKSKYIQVDVDAKLGWKGIVGSMRPMHLQSNKSPTPAIMGRPGTMPEPEFRPGGYETKEAFSPPPSPYAYSISSYDSVSDLSQYDSPCEEIITKEKCVYDDDGGDEMIDAKAEEFIAQFYEQMRLQNSN